MCTSPFKGFKNGFTDNGKDNLIVTSYSVDHIEFVDNRMVKADSKFISPYSSKVLREFIEIPCGKCMECRLKYSREWANRMMLESLDHDSNFFLTLTYDDDHVHINDFGLKTLYKKDFQDFMKRLRRYVEPDHIRFFAAGEYGDHTLRPHYHAIIFGLKISDLDPFGYSSGFPVYISKSINKLWEQGHVLISSISWDTCAYTARYVVKKANHYSKDSFHFAHVEPEFCLMSRRPWHR